MNRARIIIAAAVFLVCASAALPERMAELESALNWMQVSVEGIVTYLGPDECYIEAADRSGGIWTQGPTAGIEIGDPVIAFGTLGVVSGEPVILDASIFFHGLPTTIRPLGMKNAAVGGASKWSPMCIWDLGRTKVLEGHQWTWHFDWVQACGASNTGLLVKTWGTVRSVYYSPVNGARWFYIDDGSSPVSDLGDVGVLVYGDAEVRRGDVVCVQGISSLEPSIDQHDRMIRVLRTRDAADVEILKPAELPTYPFSDEFDGQRLDRRWILDLPPNGSVSTTAEPGWLAITAQPDARGAAYSPRVVQFAPGDWDLEIKVRDPASQAPGHQCGSAIVLQPNPFYRPWTGFPIPPDPFLLGLLGGTSRGYLSSCAQVENRVQLGQVIMDIPGDTCYFRFRCREGRVYANVSFDGVSYLPDDVVILQRGWYPALDRYLCLYVVSSLNRDCGGTAVPYTAYFDYVRFTSVGLGGESE